MVILMKRRTYDQTILSTRLAMATHLVLQLACVNISLCNLARITYKRAVGGESQKQRCLTYVSIEVIHIY